VESMMARMFHRTPAKSTPLVGVFVGVKFVSSSYGTDFAK